MASKCLHKGCGKLFTDPSEPCTYHPGPPEFHEGTKGESPATLSMPHQTATSRKMHKAEEQPKSCSSSP